MSALNNYLSEFSDFGQNCVETVEADVFVKPRVWGVVNRQPREDELEDPQIRTWLDLADRCLLRDSERPT